MEKIVPSSSECVLGPLFILVEDANNLIMWSVKLGHDDAAIQILPDSDGQGSS